MGQFLQGYTHLSEFNKLCVKMSIFLSVNFTNKIDLQNKEINHSINKKQTKKPFKTMKTRLNS